MTRFWITLPQGVNFVLSSLAMAQGGEVFVPKIPTMTTVDLATALAPDLPRKIIGIRPGEKLHEVMISADDSRATVEYSDRYAICPSFDVTKYEAHVLNGAAPVADGFAYTSDTNSERLEAGGPGTVAAAELGGVKAGTSGPGRRHVRVARPRFDLLFPLFVAKPKAAIAVAAMQWCDLGAK